MNDLTRQATSTLQRMWRHRWIGVGVAWGVALLGGAVTSAVPERFEARARVYVDTQTVLKPLMVGLTYQPDIDQQVRMLGRTLISRPNIERLVAMPTVGKDKNSSDSTDAQIESLLKAIKVEQTGGNNLYDIRFRDQDPKRAEALVAGLVTLFMDTGVDGKRQKSMDASRFIDDQIKSYEVKLVAAESRVKEFKVRNMGVTSATNQDYFARVSSISDEVNNTRVQLNAAERSRDAIRQELNAEAPQMPPGSASAASVTPELDSRIEVQRRQLDEMLRRYTDMHPDVVTTRRTIAELESARRREAEERLRAGKGRAYAATNPVYQTLRVRLTEAEAKVASLRGQLGVLQSRLEESRSQAGRVPQAEAELAQLTRDYDVIRKNYQELVERREAANLGVKIDQRSLAADFRVIEPPRVLPNAVFPSRMHMAIATLLLSLIAGLVAAYGMTMLQPTFSSERELREFTKRPVLGSIHVIADSGKAMIDRADRMKLAGALGLLMLVCALWIVWIALHPAVAPAV